MAASILRNWSAGIASSSFFAEFLMTILYMDGRFSLSAVNLVTFFLFAHPIFDNLQVCKVFQHFLNPCQFFHIKNRSRLMPFRIGYILFDMHYVFLFLCYSHERLLFLMILYYKGFIFKSFSTN